MKKYKCRECGEFALCDNLCVACATIDAVRSIAGLPVKRLEESNDRCKGE